MQVISPLLNPRCNHAQGNRHGKAEKKRTPGQRLANVGQKEVGEDPSEWGGDGARGFGVEKAWSLKEDGGRAK